MTAQEKVLEYMLFDLSNCVQQTTTRPMATPCSLVFSLQTYDTGSGVTHLFLARPQPSQWPALSGRSLVQQVVHLARDMQVTIAADRAARQQPHPV